MTLRCFAGSVAVLAVDSSAPLPELVTKESTTLSSHVWPSKRVHPHFEKSRIWTPWGRMPMGSEAAFLYAIEGQVMAQHPIRRPLDAGVTNHACETFIPFCPLPQ